MKRLTLGFGSGDELVGHGTEAPSGSTLREESV